MELLYNLCVNFTGTNQTDLDATIDGTTGARHNFWLSYTTSSTTIPTTGASSYPTSNFTAALGAIKRFDWYERESFSLSVPMSAYGI